MSKVKGKITILTLMALAASFVGCTHAAGPLERAQAMCKRIVSSSETFAGAYSTTAGKVRSHAIGPGTRPGANAWSGTADATEAAWCWIDRADGQRTVLAVMATGQPVLFFTASASSLQPSRYGPQIP
jgi:hypothetical protein